MRGDIFAFTAGSPVASKMRTRSDPEKYGMNDHAAEMMELLQELARMKEMDAKFEQGAKNEAEAAEHESRKIRRREVCDKIAELGGTVS